MTAFGFPWFKITVHTADFPLLNQPLSRSWSWEVCNSGVVFPVLQSSQHGLENSRGGQRIQVAEGGRQRRHLSHPVPHPVATFFIPPLLFRAVLISIHRSGFRAATEMKFLVSISLRPPLPFPPLPSAPQPLTQHHLS